MSENRPGLHTQKIPISALIDENGHGNDGGHKQQVQNPKRDLNVNGEGNSGNIYSAKINHTTQNSPIHSVNSEGNTISDPNLFKINLSDIEDEIRYWETAVVCFVVGANPPLHVIDGFVRQI